MAEITPQQVINALDIPTKDEIKAAMKLPTRDMIISRMFNRDITSDDYMLKALSLDECVNDIVSRFSDRLESHRNDMLEKLSESLPNSDVILSSFRDHYPTKNEIISLVSYPEAKDLTDSLHYPCTYKNLNMVLPYLSNKENFSSKFNVITQKTILATLDDIYESAGDEDKLKIEKLMTLVPDRVITESDINFLIPAEDKRNQLIAKLNSSINVAIMTISESMEFYNKKEIIDQIKDTKEIDVDSINNAIPDIPCRENILNLFKNVILNDEAIYENLGIATLPEVCEQLNIQRIIDTYELPSTDDILGSLKVPDQVGIVNVIKDAIPSASDFITSLGLPSQLDICILLNELPYIESDMILDIADVICSKMPASLSAIQFQMGLQSKVDVVNDLIAIDGKIPPTNEIRNAIPISSYSEIAARLNFPSSSVMAATVQKFMSNQIDIESLGEDISEANDIISRMVDAVTPKRLVTMLGKEKYNQLESFFNSGKSPSEVLAFLNNGW